MSTKSWVPDIVIYHHPCMDGFAAATAVYARFGTKVTRYIGAAYGDQPPIVDDMNVLIVDFSYKRDQLEQMARRAKSVVVLDHHKTAKEDLAGFPNVYNQNYLNIREFTELYYRTPCVSFDMDKSGAMMAWKFCNPEALTVLPLIRYVQDRDLWLFKLPGTRPFHYFLSSLDFDLDVWKTVLKTAHGEVLTNMLETGRGIGNYYTKRMRELADNVMLHRISGYMVPTVNCNYMFASELGNYLLDIYPDAPFAATYCDVPIKFGNGKIMTRKISLRSKDNREDVSNIAKHFGGGGHRNAAGFTINIGSLLG